MALTDTQIERYSRQILLPEIGGRGQEALLRSTAIIVGGGALADALVPYLAGAGIGHLVFHLTPGDDASAARRLADRVAQINPEVETGMQTRLGSVRADERRHGGVLCETSGRQEGVLSLVGAARTVGAAVVAGGIAGACGWLSTTGAGVGGPGCAFCGWLAARRIEPAESTNPFTPTVMGAVASLMAASVLDASLGLDRGTRGEWLRYDSETLTLEAQAIARREDCPLCGEAGGETSCHPTLDS